MRLKSVLAWVLTAFCLLLSGCDRLDTDKSETVSLDIYATVFPIYAIAQRITRDVPDISLHCLVDPQDADFELYEISDRDMALLSGADAVIVGGSGLESFSFAQNEGPAIIEVLPEMDHMIRNGSKATNPHIYVTADGILEIASRLTCAMSLLDPRYDDMYAENYEALEKEVQSLIDSIACSREAVKGNNVLVLDDTCAYIAREFGLESVEYTDRCSGTDLSREETDSMLTEFSRHDCRTVIVEAQVPTDVRYALESEGYRIIALDVLTTVTETEGFEGMIDRLCTNAETIRSAIADTGEGLE